MAHSTTTHAHGRSAQDRLKSALALLLTIALAASLTPFAAHPALANPTSPDPANASTDASTDASTSTDAWPANIDALLASGDYVEGEAIVVMRADAAAPYSLRSRTIDPLANAEHLASASAESYEQAVNNGEGDAAELAGSEAADAAAANAGAGAKDAEIASPFARLRSTSPAASADATAEPEEETADVSIVLVKMDGMSTREILESLVNDSRVLMAQPNYVRSIDGLAVDGVAPATIAEPDAGTFATFATESLGADNTGNTDAGLDTTSAADTTDAGLDTTSAADPDPTSTQSTVVIPMDEIADHTLIKDPIDLTPFQWGLDNRSKNTDGSAVLVTPLAASAPDDFDINAPDWNNPNAQNADCVVAVFDTGVDYTHPDLAGVMMDNMTDYNPAGGAYGFNAGAEPNSAEVTDPMDKIDHGTHVAGIIASNWNGIGTSGVASGVKLVAVRSADDAGNLTDSFILRGYQYLSDAIDGGLNLVAINNSWGGNSLNGAIMIAINELGSKGAISVFSSGNSTTNTDANADITAAMHDSPYLVSANASTVAGRMAAFTNYGYATSDVFAPGQGIMSTVPISKPAYNPLADPEPIIFHSFDNDDLSDLETLNRYTKEPISSYQTTAADLPAGVNPSLKFDAEGGALAVRAGDILDPDDPANIEGMVRFNLSVQGNTEAEALEAVKKASFASVNIAASEGSYGAFAYMLVSVNGRNTWVNASFESVESNGWTAAVIDFKQAMLGTDGLVCTVEQQADGTYAASISIGVMFLNTNFELGINPDTWFYFDTLGIGSNAIAYNCYNGTSMAAPMATGAAAILATRYQAGEGDSAASATARSGAQGATARNGASPARTAEDAAELAALVKGSVRPIDTFEPLCTSGGHIDLSLTRDQFVPVVSDAQLASGASADADGSQADASTQPAANQLEISGWWFGSTPGSVSIDGKSAEVISWSEEADGQSSITVKLPAGLESGVLPVAVTAANGNTGKNGFLLELAESSADPSSPTFAIPLFERSIDLTAEACSGLAELSPQNAMVGYGGELYVFVNNGVSVADSAFRYNPATDTVSPVALPEGFGLKSASAVTYNGKLLVMGSTHHDAVPPSSAEGTMALYAYDLETDTWEQLDLPAGVPYLSQLVNFDGTLLTIGGGDGDYLPYGMATPLEKNNVCKIDLEAGTATPVGTLITPRFGMVSTTTHAAADAAAGDNANAARVTTRTPLRARPPCTSRAAPITPSYPSPRLRPSPGLMPKRPSSFPRTPPTCCPPRPPRTSTTRSSAWPRALTAPWPWATTPSTQTGRCLPTTPSISGMMAKATPRKRGASSGSARCVRPSWHRRPLPTMAGSTSWARAITPTPTWC